MHRRVRVLAALTVVMVLLLSLVGSAAGHDGQHGPDDGHLIGTGEWGKIDFVAKLTVHDAEPDLIADVAVFGDYAYSRVGVDLIALAQKEASRTAVSTSLTFRTPRTHAKWASLRPTKTRW